MFGLPLSKGDLESLLWYSHLHLGGFQHPSSLEPATLGLVRPDLEPIWAWNDGPCERSILAQHVLTTYSPSWKTGNTRKSISPNLVFQASGIRHPGLKIGGYLGPCVNMS